MLEIKDIYKTFNAGTVNEKCALKGLNLTLKEGDFVTVIGGNGAGKSTMLNAVAGVWPVDSGSITIGGVDVTHLPEYKRAAFIGRVFQDPMMGTAPTMQIEENLALALRRGQPRGLKWGITREERELYREQLKRFDLGLEDRLTSKVGLLSGGQRQALTLLMASLKKPKLLILDEPTAGLDPAGCRQIMDNICAYRQQTGSTIIIVSHNMDDAAKYAQRVIVFNRGSVVMDGSPEEVFSRAQELCDIGLGVPMASQIAMELRAKGMALEGSIFTRKQLVEAILKAKGVAAC